MASPPGQLGSQVGSQARGPVVVQAGLLEPVVKRATCPPAPDALTAAQLRLLPLRLSVKGLLLRPFRAFVSGRAESWRQAVRSRQRQRHLLHRLTPVRRAGGHWGHPYPYHATMYL